MSKKPVQTKAEIYQILGDHQSTIIDYGVKRLGLFGSFVRQQQQTDSDVDLLVDFESNQKKYANFIGLVYFLEDVLHRPVELITSDSLTKHLKPHIEKEVEYVVLGK
ncbi:MAG: nucleotidyltransferase family protein [Candidatus Kerfeldbacteria bacterium]|nr:nucleotidyltransferase family protein [Candidatus Kerfeldbacteria bacterium]